MRQKTVITRLLQNVTEAYYKVRHVLQCVTEVYYKERRVLQSASGIRKCHILLLESASGIARCDSYYKVRRNTDPYFPVFRLNTGKYGLEKLSIWTLFTQCYCSELQ